MKILTKNLEETEKMAEIFAKNLPEDGAFVLMFGEIGAGKTAFIRPVLKGLGVKEKITSPSFVILNEYKGARLPVYHFDLYRLENEGVETIKEELREYSKTGVLTFVEWADFGKAEMPCDTLNIRVSYTENFDDVRIYEFIPEGQKYVDFVEKLEIEAKKAGF